MDEVYNEFVSEEFKINLKKALHDPAKDLLVTFVKSDGTERTMRCTTSEDIIPSDLLPKETGRATSDETCRVFDTEKQQWRSFRWDSITAVTGL